MSVDIKKQSFVHMSKKQFHRVNIDELSEKLDQLQVRKEEINSNFSDFEHFYDEYGDNWRMLGSVNNWYVNRVVELVQIEEDKIWKELEVIKEEICELTTKILESMSEIEKIEEYCSKHCLDSNGNKK